MATNVLTDSLEEVVTQRERSWFSRAGRGVLSFARRKPLGAFCGLIVILFMVVGDVVPVTLNAATQVVGLGTPVPYVSDALEKNTGFIYPYSRQRLSERLQGPSSAH